MESEWGRNVARYDLVNWRCSLCARILSGPLAGDVLTNYRRGTEVYNWFTDPGTGEMMAYVNGEANASVNFPYGMDVEPP